MPWLLTTTLLTAILLLAAHGYLGWRACRVIKKFRARVSFFIFLFSFYLYPLAGLIWFLSRGDVTMLALWHPLAYWFWFGFVFSIFFFSWVIILDVLAFCARRFWKNHPLQIEMVYRRIFWALSILLFIITAAKMIHDTRGIQINRLAYTSKKVPPGLDGFRIVHISDIHGDEYTGRRRRARYIKKINALHPDLIVFTGDLISYGTDFIAEAAQELSKARARYGTYAVMGDHDYWAGASTIKQALVKNGIHVLRDENTFIAAKNDSLLLTGVTEVYSKHIPCDSLRMLTHNHAQFPLKILASHQPTDNVIHTAQKANYQLLLAGHTHGGQLRVPFLFWSFSAAELDTKYLSGPFKFGPLLMNVNNGLGFTLAPVRYNAPATISVIDLSMK